MLFRSSHAFCCFFVLVGCVKAEVVSLVHPEATSYSSLAYGGTEEPPADFVRGTIPESVRPIVQETVRAEIIDRLGYTSEGHATADLLLYVGVGRRVDVETTTLNEIPGRGNSIHPTYLGTFEEQIETGTLVFDAFDRSTGLHVWHGQITSVIRGDIDPERLQELLVELFGTFPTAPQ